MSKPTIVLIPGLWVGPTIYTSLSHTLNSAPHHLPTLTIPLPSTDLSPPDNGTLQSDVRAIRAALEPLVERDGRDVVLVMHSAAGFLGSNALKGLGRDERERRGERGGVVVLVFLAAGLLEEGVRHEDPPFLVKDETSNTHLPISPSTTLFGNLRPAVAARHLALLKPQPATGWNDTITYAAWKHLPSIFVIPEDDKLLPPALQEQFAEVARSEVVRVPGAGHMIMLEREDICVEVVVRAVAIAMGRDGESEGKKGGS